MFWIKTLGSVEDGSVEVSSVEVGSVEFGSVEVGSVEVGYDEVGSVEFGSEEAGFLEVGSEEFGSGEVGSDEVGSVEGSGTGGWRRWTGWAWTGRSSNTAFRRLETTYRGALETAVASRILAAAALVLALRTAGTERPIAQRVLELATRVRGACSIGSGSIRGVYTTKSRDPHVRSISINVGYRGE